MRDEINFRGIKRVGIICLQSNRRSRNASHLTRCWHPAGVRSLLSDYRGIAPLNPRLMACKPPACYMVSLTRSFESTLCHCPSESTTFSWVPAMNHFFLNRAADSDSELGHTIDLDPSLRSSICRGRSRHQVCKQTKRSWIQRKKLTTKG